MTDANQLRPVKGSLHKINLLKMTDASYKWLAYTEVMIIVVMKVRQNLDANTVERFYLHLTCAHAVTYITEIMMNVTLSNQSHSFARTLFSCKFPRAWRHEKKSSPIISNE